MLFVFMFSSIFVHLFFVDIYIYICIYIVEEVVNVIVEGGAVPALVKHLQAPPLPESDRGPKPYEHEVEKGSAFALGLLAVKVALSLLIKLILSLYKY